MPEQERTQAEARQNRGMPVTGLHQQGARRSRAHAEAGTHRGRRRVRSRVHTETGAHRNKCALERGHVEMEIRRDRCPGTRASRGRSPSRQRHVGTWAQRDRSILRQRCTRTEARKRPARVSPPLPHGAKFLLAPSLLPCAKGTTKRRRCLANRAATSFYLGCCFQAGVLSCDRALPCTGNPLQAEIEGTQKCRRHFALPP